MDIPPSLTTTETALTKLDFAVVVCIRLLVSCALRHLLQASSYVHSHVVERMCAAGGHFHELMSDMTS